MATAIPDVKKTWGHAIRAVTLGALKEEGGSRTSTVTVGGAQALPFLHFEGATPHRPAVAMEVWDVFPEDWPDLLRGPFGEALKDPGQWAAKCVTEFGADLICLRLVGCHPDGAKRTPGQAAEAVKRVLSAVGVPLIIWGCGVDETDNEVFPAVAEAAQGENCLLGTITEDNYKTLVALCTAYKHKLLAESPCDINIAKQVNILATDMGFPLEEIVIFPSTGALGYGIEYIYSIMERARLAALKGDRLLAQPILVDVGMEAWGVKEAKAPEAEVPEWGEQARRAPLWEAATADVYLMAGADILVMRHPEAVAAVKRTIEQLMQAGSD